MLAGGQFGNDAAVLRMKPNLRGDDVAENSTVPYHRDAGLVAGRFDSENDHEPVSSERQQRQLNVISVRLRPCRSWEASSREQGRACCKARYLSEGPWRGRVARLSHCVPG